MPFRFRTLVAAALLCATPLLPATAQNLTRADVEAIVQQYIEKNGDRLMDAIVMAQQKQQLARAASVVSRHTPVVGPANAPVTIIEFSDFECPFCERVQPTLAQVKSKYNSRIRWAFKNLPLEFHAKARPAAYAAMAAHLQGKFTPYSQALWQNQAYLGDQLYTKLAQELGLDMKKWEADRNSAKVKTMVEQDLADGESVGARGTPFFLINGQPVSGAMPYEAFSKAIEAALTGKGN